LYVRRSDGAPVEPARVRGRIRELLFEWRDLAAIPGEDNVPAWYAQRPYLEVSDFNEWAPVARAMERLYAPQMRGGPRLAEVAQEVKASGGSPEQQALRALQYVQQDIRYTSIAIGPGSHRPADPETVLERKFGDCKDKSVLLIALLAQLGIEAQPALVHSRRGRVLRDTLPSPYAFNHVIVRVPIGTQVFWIDGTSSPQYSPLAEDAPADFEHALIVSGDTTDLVTIPRPAPDSQRKEVSYVFDLKAGMDKPATLRMTTRYIGPLADQIRAGLEFRTVEQRSADYLSYIARYYPGAKAAGDIRIADDKRRNVLEVHEQYTLDPAFVENDEGWLKLALHADEMYPYVDSLSFAARSAPLSLAYPVNVRQQLVAHLPEAWSIRAGTVKVDNPAFRYRSDVDYAARTLELVYEYQALADHVAPAALKQYLSDRKRAYDDMGYEISRRIEGRSSEPLAIAPAPLFALLGSLALSIWAAMRWGYRKDPEPRVAPDEAPVGFGGWLILPALGVILGPVVSLYVIVSWAPFISAELWQTLPSTVIDGYESWAQPVLLGIVVFSGPLLVGHVLLAVLFFKKRTSAPLAFVILTWFGYLYGEAVVRLVFAGGLDEESTRAQIFAQSIRDGVSTLLWTIYMLRSRRVRATFRERYRRSVPVAEPAQVPA
jgi:hypothetical protein